MTVTSSLAAYPGLRPVGVSVSPASPQSGGPVTVTWSDVNAGGGAATVGWNDRLVVTNAATGCP